MASGLIQTIQIAGIISSAGLSGLIACFSYVAVPAINFAPIDTRVQQWKIAYKIGARTAPLLAISSAACFAYLAYASRALPGLGLRIAGVDVASPAVLYGVAAALNPSIAPYTILVMAPAVNDRLMGLAEAAEKGKKGDGLGISGEELDEVMRRWTRMNYTRAFIVGVGAVLGAVATVAL